MHICDSFASENIYHSAAMTTLKFHLSGFVGLCKTEKEKVGAVDGIDWRLVPAASYLQGVISYPGDLDLQIMIL